MISPSLKPHSFAPRPFPKPERLTKRGRMTIAIGMLCQDGLVLAVDTQMTWPDGTTYDAVKMQTLATQNGAFALAYTCFDMNAAETLVNDLIKDLRLAAPKSLAGVEDTIKNRMAQWSSVFTVKDDRPLVTIIAGARINPGEFGLYLCEPPGTVVRKTFANSDGYVAAGAGQIVTDPMFRTLFGPPVPPRVCLAQISYLMYRAKKDCRGACGGATDAVLLSMDHAEPLWIQRPLMKIAELRGGFLDKALGHVASKILSRHGFDDESRFAELFDPKAANKLFGSSPLFIARTGEVIRENELQKMIDARKNNPEN
jgi:20S proteasome alpha/beta subunit